MATKGQREMGKKKAAKKTRTKATGDSSRAPHRSFGPITDTGDFLEKWLKEIASSADASLAALTLPGGHESAFETYYATTRGKLRRVRSEVSGKSADIQTHVIEKRKSKLVGNISGDRDFDWKPILKIMPGASSAICVPVGLPGEMPGSLLAVRNKAARPFKSPDTRELATTAILTSTPLATILLLRKYRHRTEQLESFFRISDLINSSLDVDTILESVLKTATELVRAEASSILLVEEDSREVVFRTTLGSKADKVKSLKLELGEGIAGWVALTGEPVLAHDAGKDPRHASYIPKKLRFKTRNILCVPIKVKNHTIGSVEVINKIGGKDVSFDNEDLELLTAIAGQASIAIENARLYNEAMTDELTGLFSYRYFQTYFQREVKRAERKKFTMSLLMIDLDNFKNFNDKYGHATGNLVLRTVAKQIQSNVRTTDVVARYGGEEIVIILHDAEKKIAMTIAERVRADIEAFKIRDDKHGVIGVTCSVGVASYPEDTTDMEELFFRADHALHEAKLHGKNRVRSLTS